MALLPVDFMVIMVISVVISGFLWLLDAVHGHQWFSRSVGPTQMFMLMLVLVWLMAVFGHRSREERKRIIISYDNMCHLR